MSESHKGKEFSEETKRKISERLKGIHRSEETKRKISKALKGKPNGLLGKHWKLSEKTRIRIGQAHKGSKCYFWKGGISFELYSPAWTSELRQAIRQRDDFICQICGKYPAFDVHHIDYNKKNCEPKNLIILCRNCHSKTNYNRDYWIKYFYACKCRRIR